jgi:hypothetical protein
MLLAGFLAGGLAASVIWAVTVSKKRRALEALRLEREQIMASVGEALAEADAIEAGFRSGAADVDGFRRGLSARVSAVMRLLRTNMHTLDAFFVKYAEREACEYLRLIDNPERRKPDGARFPAPEAEAPVAPAPAYAPAAAALGAAVAAGYDAAEYDDAAEYEAAAEDDAAADEAVDYVPGDVAYEPAPPETGIIEEAAFPPAPETGIIEEAAFPPPPETGIIETAGIPPTDRFPALGDAGAEEELFQPAAPAPAFDAVNEEELVLGESPDGAFEPPPPAPPPPQPQPRSDEAWTGGDSIDEFEEAAYAQFEAAAPTPPPEPRAAYQDYQETGKFANSAAGDDHLLTETSSIDKSAILNAMAASGQPLPPTQTPLPARMPEPPPPEQEQQEHQGITGDDVVDSIDNFFKLG